MDPMCSPLAAVEAVTHPALTRLLPASFVRPSMEFADIIVPRAGTNSIAVKILLREIKARMGDDLGISIPP